MALIPVGSSQVNLRYSGANMPNGAEWTFGVNNPNTLSPTDIADLVIAHYQTAGMTGFHVSNVVLESVLVKNGPTATGPSGEVTASINGFLTGHAMPGQVATLVRKITAFGGRAGRGRAFIPGVGEEQISGESRYSPADQAARQGYINDFHDLLVGSVLSPVVLHGAGSPITVPSPIVEWQVDALVATQRRRLRG